MCVCNQSALKLQLKRCHLRVTYGTQFVSRIDRHPFYFCRFLPSALSARCITSNDVKFDVEFENLTSRTVFKHFNLKSVTIRFSSCLLNLSSSTSMSFEITLLHEDPKVVTTRVIIAMKLSASKSPVYWKQKI